MTDITTAEHHAWHAYRDYCEERVSPHFGGSSGWSGDKASAELWETWQPLYEARVNAPPAR